MASRIQEWLNDIKNAIYGEEVRDAIHNSIEECYNDVSSGKTIAEQAASAANTAASAVNTAKSNADAATTKANNAASAANTAAGAANQAKTDADAATKKANDAATAATTAKNGADKATADARQAISDTETAITNAEAATKKANDAAGTANTAAGAANTAKANADTATSNANKAAGTANTAAENANKKADLANTAATNANEKASAADLAATRANTATTELSAAAKEANDAADNANEKATAANTAANKANSSASAADAATERANAATQLADAAATNTQLAIGQCNNAAQSANTSADLASRAASRATASADKLDNMTVTSENVGPNTPAEATLSEVDGHFNVHFVLRQGADGNPYTIKGEAYPDLGALSEAVPSPAVGDLYNVGTEAPFNVYRWTGSDWEDQGKIGVALDSIKNYDIDSIWDESPVETHEKQYLDFSGLVYLISEKIKAALNEKVDAVIGKGLSSNDFTNDYIQKIEDLLTGVTSLVQSVETLAKTGTVWQALTDASDDKILDSNGNEIEGSVILSDLRDSKVDKVPGKGLSSNDFTDEYKRKIDELVQFTDILAKTQTIWRNLEDSDGGVILDSYGAPVECRTVFARL